MDLWSSFRCPAPLLYRLTEFIDPLQLRSETIIRKDLMAKMPSDSFDYIVVGAGSAGRSSPIVSALTANRIYWY
ncbi:hypothetical protein CK230_14525 [Mesorhizobium sp. WSM3859]|nr:hypothetical protein CK230_14525 [Mesorhizobium sp. WSM3859]